MALAGERHPLPKGWSWKNDPTWDNVVACASDGTYDVWVSMELEVYVYGPSSGAPAAVLLAVMARAGLFPKGT